MRRATQFSFVVSLAIAAPVASVAQAPRALSDSAFAALIERMSEPSGYFDTDNLISNEDSYLHAVSSLRRLGVSGGVYVGVGPDQNFSFIAAVRPRAAFIVDIRRDNLLEHLLFKSIFALSRNRADYLALLFGRTPPADSAGWSTRSVDSLLVWVSRERADSASAASVSQRVLARLKSSAVRLSAGDLQTIARFHTAFIAAGPALRFNSFGRAPQPYYPDYRRLASETDREGKQASFLANESDFLFVKGLEDRNLIVPLVGNFAGTHTFSAVAAWMSAAREQLSALYTSNVEQYLFQDGSFGAFAQNVARFPRNPQSVLIRSCFVCGYGHPQALAGYHAVQLVQLVDQFVALGASGAMVQYRDLLVGGVPQLVR